MTIGYKYKNLLQAWDFGAPETMCLGEKVMVHAVAGAVKVEALPDIYRFRPRFLV